MRILFLTQIVPYPPDAGPKVKTWHVLRYLVQSGHQVILATFCREDEEEHIETLRNLCEEVIPIPIKRSRLADIKFLIKSLITGRPFLIERDDLTAMRNLVDSLVSNGKVDVIHADQLSMAQFAFQPKDQVNWPITIFDAHNAVWTIVERTKEGANFLLKPILGIEAQRIRYYEGKIVTDFDHTLAVSETDKAALLEVCSPQIRKNILSSKITVIPIAADTEALAPVKRKQGSKNIFTLGTLHYPPNADGIRWFTNQVFPLILDKMPDATLTIVGKNPPSDFVQLAKNNPSIIVTGYVPDLTPYFESSAMLVVPVRAGGGIRVRILEAFSRAMPVITTTIGLEGIDAQPGVDVLVEDDNILFAEAALELMSNEFLQEQLSRNGRKLAKTHYDWQIILKDLDKVYDTLQK